MKLNQWEIGCVPRSVFGSATTRSVHVFLPLSNTSRVVHKAAAAYMTLYLLLHRSFLAGLRRLRLRRLAPVQELLLEQDGLVVLRQPAKYGPVWAPLALPENRRRGGGGTGRSGKSMAVRDHLDLAISHFASL